MPSLNFQKNDYCFIELIVDMRKFQRKLEVDQNNNYYGLATHGILLKIENEYGLQKREAIEAEFQVFFRYSEPNKIYIQEFYSTTREYFNTWVGSLNKYNEKLDWLKLDETPITLKWDSFSDSVRCLNQKMSEDDRIYHDFCELQEILPKLVNNEGFRSMSMSSKWAQILRNGNFEILPRFIQEVYLQLFIPVPMLKAI